MFKHERLVWQTKQWRRSRGKGHPLLPRKSIFKEKGGRTRKDEGLALAVGFGSSDHWLLVSCFHEMVNMKAGRVGGGREYSLLFIKDNAKSSETWKGT